MDSRSPKPTRSRARLPLDIAPQALSIGSLNYRRAVAPPRSDVHARVRCEFVEMRGFSPTIAQAARLFQLQLDECGRILKGLVEEGFLRQTADGRFRLPS
ncbi:MAG TPA: hypothetical protein VI485_13215 [Vicinamibacterales bacterium]|nr:hypothetical protein [Vicinamibacterales bacterium]